MVTREERIQEARGQKGFVDLLSIRGSRSQKHVGDNKERCTLLDKRLRSANQLYTISSRLEDANTVLELCCTMLADNCSTFLERRQMVNSLRRLLIPLNKAASQMLHEGAKNVAPIGGCHKYHKRCETERKRMAQH